MTKSKRIALAIAMSATALACTPRAMEGEGTHWPETRPTYLPRDNDGGREIKVVVDERRNVTCFVIDTTQTAAISCVDGTRYADR